MLVSIHERGIEDGGTPFCRQLLRLCGLGEAGADGATDEKVREVGEWRSSMQGRERGVVFAHRKFGWLASALQGSSSCVRRAETATGVLIAALLGSECGRATEYT